MVRWRGVPRPAPPGGALQHEHMHNPDDAAMLNLNAQHLWNRATHHLRLGW